MVIVKDLRILKPLSKKFDFEYDPKHRYVTKSDSIEENFRTKKELQKAGYDLKYFDGCFYPFIVRL